MIHVILFCYIFSILIGVSVFTIQFLADRRQKNSNNKINKYFITALLVMNLYDLLIYYNDNMLGGDIDQIAMVRVGDCFIAITICMWLRTQEGLLKERTFPWVISGVRIFTVIYIVAWAICTFLLSENAIDKWVYAFTDIVLLCFLVMGSVAYAGQAMAEGQSKPIQYYMVIVTIMMSCNYITYFTSELGTRWGQTDYIDGPMNLTIFYWFIINAANLIMSYRNNFANAYKEVEKVAVFELDTALKELQEKYDLTAREKDLVKEIYEGKSNGEIASDLFISESTVKTHIYNIFRKLNVKNRVEVVCAVRGEEKTTG